MVMIYNDDLTLFIKATLKNGEETYFIKHIKGLMEERVGHDKSGATKMVRKEAKVYIAPMSNYKEPIAYAKLNDIMKDQYITFKSQDKIVLGNVESFEDVDNVYTISNCQYYRSGSLSHFEITAR